MIGFDKADVRRIKGEERRNRGLSLVEQIDAQIAGQAEATAALEEVNNAD